MHRPTSHGECDATPRGVASISSRRTNRGDSIIDLRAIAYLAQRNDIDRSARFWSLKLRGLN